MRWRQDNNVRYIESVRQKSVCKDCGIDNPIVLQFHHRDGKEGRKYGLRYYITHSLERLKAEIEKCDVLCANCHLIRHHNEQTGYNAQRKAQ